MLRQETRKASLRHPTYGYRRVWAKLVKQYPGLHRSRLYRIWKGEGLALPPKKKRRGRKMGEGPRMPHRARYPNHVWCYDFVKVRLATGQSVRILTLLDECTRESLGLFIAISIPASKVRSFLEEAAQRRGCLPEYLRSDNGPEFIEQALNQWLQENGTRPIFIQPGSPWQNGKCESFNGKFREEFLDRHPHLTLKELTIRTEWWRSYYNQERPHSSLDYKTPSEFANLWYSQNPVNPPPTGTEPLRAANWGERSSQSPISRSKRFLAGSTTASL